MITLVALAAAFISLTPAPALAALPQPGATGAQSAPCPPNAALVYWRAWNGRAAAVWDNRFLEPEFTIDPAWSPSPQVCALLEAAQPDIRTILKASQIEYCDWALPVDEEGFDALVPHIVKFRVTSRVLIADARRLMALGETLGAAERLAGLVRMSLHFRKDLTVFSVRSAQSGAADYAFNEIGRLAVDGKWDEPSRAVLIEAVKKLDVPDPCGMREALRKEPEIIRSTVQRECRGPRAADLIIQKFAPSTTQDERARSGIDNLDEGAILRSADQVAVPYLEVLANWDTPDTIKQCKAIYEQKRNGDYGAVAMLSGCEIGHMRLIVARFEARVDDTLAKLGAK